MELVKKIAVVVPFKTDNELTESLLKRALDSIDERFMVIQVSDNVLKVGVSGCRNQGIDYARLEGCEYITFLDADDTYVPDAWDVITKAIEEAPDADVIQLNHMRNDSVGRAWLKYYNHRGTYNLTRLPEFWFVCWNKIVKADVLRDIRFIKGLNRGEDELFCLEVFAKTRTVYCSEGVHLIHHFDNPQSLSKTVTVCDVLAEQQALINLCFTYQNDRELLEAVRVRQVQLWNCPVYTRLFGGA